MVFAVEHVVDAAEPQHDDAVGDGLHVGHRVADQHDGVAALAQPDDQREQLGGLPQPEGGGRLVEHDHPRRAEQRARDRDDLPLAAGQRRDRDAHGRHPGGELVEQAPRVASPW